MKVTRLRRNLYTIHPKNYFYNITNLEYYGYDANCDAGDACSRLLLSIL